VVGLLAHFLLDKLAYNTVDILHWIVIMSFDITAKFSLDVVI